MTQNAEPTDTGPRRYGAWRRVAFVVGFAAYAPLVVWYWGALLVIVGVRWLYTGTDQEAWLLKAIEPSWKPMDWLERYKDDAR